MHINPTTRLRDVSLRNKQSFTLPPPSTYIRPSTERVLPSAIPEDTLRIPERLCQSATEAESPTMHPEVERPRVNNPRSLDDT
jgi:hypothetical protein